MTRRGYKCPAAHLWAQETAIECNHDATRYTRLSPAGSQETAIECNHDAAEDSALDEGVGEIIEELRHGGGCGGRIGKITHGGGCGDVSHALHIF